MLRQTGGRQSRQQQGKAGEMAPHRVTSAASSGYLRALRQRRQHPRDAAVAEGVPRREPCYYSTSPHSILYENAAAAVHGSADWRRGPWLGAPAGEAARRGVWRLARVALQADLPPRGAGARHG